jgi:hypothetical protein
MSAKAFIERVSRNKRPDRSLASELRVAVCGHFEASAPHLGFFDPQTRFALRVVDEGRAGSDDLRALHKLPGGFSSRCDCRRR